MTEREMNAMQIMAMHNCIVSIMQHARVCKYEGEPKWALHWVRLARRTNRDLRFLTSRR